VCGATLSDASWGRFTTIATFSLFYCLGMLLLVLGAGSESTGLAIGGLLLVALGAGGIKPCVGAFGADQMASLSPKDATSYWLFFYVAINLGSLVAYFAVPLLRFHFGFSAALLLPCVSMAVSTAIFLTPLRLYVRVAPQGSALLGVCRVVWQAASCTGLRGSSGDRESMPLISAAASARSSGSKDARGEGSSASLSDSAPPPGGEGGSGGSAAGGGLEDSPPSPAPAPTAATPPASWLDRAQGAPGVTDADVGAAKAIFNLLPFYALLPFFWAVYDSHSSIGLVQAERLDLCFGASVGCIQADQVAVLNPLLIVTLIPLIDKYALPAMQALPPAWASLHPTPLKRMTLGMYLATLSFALTGLLQSAIEAGAKPHVALQIPQYLVLTLAEVGVSATGLEFFFSEAPASAKSVVMALFFITTALGDLLNGVLYSALGSKVSLGALIWLVCALCGASAVTFSCIAARYVCVGQNL